MSQNSSQVQEKTHHEKLIATLEEKFVIQDGETYLKPSTKSKSLELFFDGTIKLVGFVKPNDVESPGHFLLSVSDKTVTRQICVEGDVFDDRKRFRRVVNAKFCGGKFVIGGLVKNKDISDFVVLVKDQYLKSGLQRELLALPYIGYSREHRQWILNGKVQLGHHGFIPGEERTFYALDDTLANKSIHIVPNLITDFEIFSDVFTRFIESSVVMKENQLGFLLATAFMLKSFMNNYIMDRSATGESRFIMLFSEAMSTGKTTSMDILSHGQGLTSEDNKLFLSCGNGMKIGTTTKPLKETFEQTNLFVFLNDYVPNNTIDELLLQAHEGYNQGSGSSEVQNSRASVFLTSNKEETNRMLGRVIRINYCRSEEFSPTSLAKFKQFAKSNHGYLIAWCYHFGTLWVEDTTQAFIADLDKIFQRYSNFAQGRYTRAWAATIVAYILMMSSMEKEFDLGDLVHHVLESIQCDGNCFYKVSCMEELEGNILRELEQEEEAKSWIRVGTSFHDKKDNIIPAVSIKNTSLQTFPDINIEKLSKELVSIYGENTCGMSVLFKNMSDGRMQAKKATKIPESKFSEITLKEIYKNCGKDPVAAKPGQEEESLSFDEDQGPLLLKLISIKNSVKAIKAEKRGFPHLSEDSHFYRSLSRKSKRTYLQLSPECKKNFRLGFEEGKKQRLENESEGTTSLTSN